MTTPDETESLRETTEEKLRDVGDKLLNCLSSVDKLLKHLDRLELLLSSVEQEPPTPLQEALVPSMTALISEELLQHPNEDVKILVTSCITHIARISAPDVPFNDEKMKEIFKLTVAAFEKLSHVSGRCYEKALSILENVAKVKSCLVMLDLECDDLVIEMFQNFLRVIRSNHPGVVMSSMESIMTLVLYESEEISSDLLRPLLDSVRKENETISPFSWTLGEQVIANCAVKLKPYLMRAVESTGSALDEFAQIVTNICQNESKSPQCDNSNDSRNTMVLVQAIENKLDVNKDADEQPHDVTGGLEPDMTCVGDAAQIMDAANSNIRSFGASTMDCEITKNDGSKGKPHSGLNKNSKSSNVLTNSETGNLKSVRKPISETKPDIMLKKGGHKPNSLMNLEEGYDTTWIHMGRKTTKQTQYRPAHISVTDFTPFKNPASGKDNLLSKPEKMNKGLEALVSQPKIYENTDAAPDGNCPKRDRPRRRSSTGNQDVDPNSVSMSNVDNLNPMLEETPLEPPGVRSENESEVRKCSKVEPWASLRKIKHSPRNDEKFAITPESVVAKMESKFSCEDETKPESAMNIEVGNREEAWSSAQIYIKKSRIFNATPNKDLNESSIKDLIAEPARRTLHASEEASQTRLRRRCTTASEMQNFNDSLVGNRIKVWWPMDKKFYDGVVDSYEPIKGKHKIVYDDGDVEVLNLKKQHWEVIADDVSPDEEHEIALQKLAEASDIAQKGIEKSRSEPAKGANVKSSPRGKTDNGEDSAGKPITKRMKTGSDTKKKIPVLKARAQPHWER